MLGQSKPFTFNNYSKIDKGRGLDGIGEKCNSLIARGQLVLSAICKLLIPGDLLDFLLNSVV